MEPHRTVKHFALPLTASVKKVCLSQKNPGIWTATHSGPFIQLSLNLTCSSLCELRNVDNTGLTAPRDLGGSVQLCVGQRLAGDKATTKTEPDSYVRWRKISKPIHLQKRIERSFR